MYALSGRNIITNSSGSITSFVQMTGATGASLVNMTYTGGVGTSTLNIINGGDYMVLGTVDGAVDTSNTDIASSLFVNGVQNPVFNVSRHYGSANDDGVSSITGMLSLNNGDAVTLGFASNKATVTFETHNINVALAQLR